MKKTLLFILIFTKSILYSQEKEIKFYDTNENEITKDEFLKKLDHRENLDLCFHNDTLVSCFLITRKNRSKLSDEHFTELKKTISPNLMLNKDLIVIVYNHGIVDCNNVEWETTWNMFHLDYKRKLKRIGEYDQFWIYKNKENLNCINLDKETWQEDKNQLIEKTFFNLPFHCFSAVVLNKKGEYITYFGEFGKSIIWEIAKELTKN